MKRYGWIGFLLLTFGTISYAAMTGDTPANHRVIKPQQKCDSCHGGYDICLPPCIK